MDMDLIEKLIGWGAGLGVVSAAGYSITLMRSKSNERRLQRREIQFLHNLLNFIFFVGIMPFSFAYTILDYFPNFVNKINANTFIVLMFLQVFYSITYLIIKDFQKGTKERTKKNRFIQFYSKYSNRIFGVGLLIASSTSLTFFIFIITISKATKNFPDVSVVIAIVIIYLCLYVPYYIGVLYKLSTNTLVTVYLNDGKILSNLFLSHRSFGNNIIFYDIQDEMRNKAVTIPRDNIQMMLSVERHAEYDISESQAEIKEFGSRIMKNESDVEQ